MFWLHVTAIVVFNFVLTKGASQKTLVPCFNKHINVDIQQFDPRIPIRYLNCTRILKKHVFTITFELQRRSSKLDHMVVTLFAGPCSSSTATLSIGRTFPSTHGSLDDSEPSPIASSHLPRNGRSQRGSISYEYAGIGGDLAQLTSALIHVVIRHGREDMIKGIYVVRFNP